LRVALAGVAVLAAVASAYVLGSRTAVVPAPPAFATRFVIHPPPGTQLVTGHRELAISADGQQIAFIARGDAGQHIYIRRIDSLEARQVPGTDGARDLAFSPDGEWLAFHAGNRIRKIRIDGSLPTVLADAVHSHGVTWHPTDDAIYFAPFELSPIWKVQADGQTPAVQVTTLDAARGERSHEWPVIVDGGRALLFAVNANGSDLEEVASLLTLSTKERITFRTGGSRGFGLTNNRELLLVRDRALVGARYADGRLASPELLDAASAIEDPALSPTGTLAYVPAPDYRRRSVVWFSPGGEPSDAGFGQRGFGALALSPDGRRVAINMFDDGNNDAMYVADADGGPLTQVAVPSGTTPSWSPDGRWVAQTVRQSAAGGWVQARVAMEPGRNWETLAAGMAEDAVSQWTPDGLGLLFSRRDSPTGRRFPMRLALDRSPPAATSLMDGGGNHIVQSPALSPDGRWLAYESNESGRLEVYVQRYPSAGARIQVSRDGGAWPTWSKRGDALYFAAGSTIMSSAITTQPELRSAAPRTIVNDPLLVRPIAGARSFDVAPDGRILVIKEDGSVRSDHIVVVQNWLPEARARGTESRR
jgi:serine/threonine-protein kinase